MRLTWLLALGLTLTAFGCHPGSSAPPPPKDAAVFDFALDLPPGCPPATPNEKGVGIPCTRGGGECSKSGVPKGLLCTCEPLAQSRVPEQSVVQLLPLQRTAPAQALPPRQLMVLLPAEAVTVEPQALGPVHWRSQVLPPQVMAPLEEPVPEQVMVLIDPPPA